MLRGITLFADVSIFALDLTTAMGLALAIDYTLLLISRYREEYLLIGNRDEALRRAMAKAGRTILFSACTVFLAVGALAVFPMYFLRSMAYAGCGVVALAGLYAIVVAPVVIKLLGDRIAQLPNLAPPSTQGPGHQAEFPVLHGHLRDAPCDSVRDGGRGPAADTRGSRSSARASASRMIASCPRAPSHDRWATFSVRSSPATRRRRRRS